MNSASFLNRLDTEKETIASRPKHLRIAKVIKTLMNNPAPVSKPTLLGLTKGGDFVALEPRQQLLIHALVVIRPAAPEAVQYWDSHSQPESIFADRTINAICDNGTEPALALLEKKLADPGFDLDDRIMWMRYPILVHRNDPPLLAVCERMITRTLPMELRPYLVEALCDYRRDWYLSCLPPKPPPRALASPEARQHLRTICRYAREHLKLSASLELAVKTTQIEIGDRQEN
jgi:hypothetical protein